MNAIQDMRVIQTSFGALYLEEFDKREDSHRLKLYDSHKCYLDSFNVDALKETAATEKLSCKDYIESIVMRIQNMQDVHELFDYLNISIEIVSTDADKIAEYIGSHKRGISAQDYLPSNEWIALIGDSYVVIHGCPHIDEGIDFSIESSSNNSHRTAYIVDDSQIFYSQKDAAGYIGCDPSSIYDAIKAGRKIKGHSVKKISN